MEGRVKPPFCTETPPGPTRTRGGRTRWRNLLASPFVCCLAISPAWPPRPPPSSSPSSSAPSGRSMSAAVLALSASSPVLVKTWMRFSSGRPIQRVRGGLTCIFAVPVWPGGISSAEGENWYLSSLSWSAASSATVSGPLAVLLTATSKFAFLRPDARSGESLVLNSSNGRIPSDSGAAAACLRVGLRLADDLELPQPRLGLGRARRVEVDLHLLLVGPARAERHQVDGVREDRPPVVRESAH